MCNSRISEFVTAARARTSPKSVSDCVTRRHMDRRVIKITRMTDIGGLSVVGGDLERDRTQQL